MSLNKKLSRRSDESNLAYQKRIVRGKLVDRTLADEDFSDLAELVYGRAYAPDVARRMFYGAQRAFDAMDESTVEAISDIEVLEELESKRVEMIKERQRLFDQRREYRKQIISDGRKEYLWDVLGEAARELADTVGALDRHPRHAEPAADVEAVLVLTDWHYGMVANNIFNTYNTEICKRRVSHVVSLATERLERHRVSKLNIVILGDMFHGAIHTSARVASEELVADQIMQVSEIIAQAVAELSNSVDVVDVHMTYGNHSRTVQNKKDNIHRDNMERIIPWWLKERLKGIPQINFVDDNGHELLTFKVCGRDVCAAHGDLDNIKASPKLLSTLLSKEMGLDLQYVLLGDKHHRESFEELGVTAMICGSLCGADDYANDKRLFSEPSQILLIFDEENGLDAEYRLGVGQRKE